MSIPQLIVRIADLAEAEGRSLRAVAIRLTLGVCTIIVAAAAALVGVMLLLGSVYIATADRAGAAAGALAAALLSLTIGGLLAWLGRRIAA